MTEPREQYQAPAEPEVVSIVSDSANVYYGAGTGDAGIYSSIPLAP